MINRDRTIIFLDTFPFEWANSIQFQKQVVKVMVEPNVAYLERLGFNIEPMLYANAIHNFEEALKNEGLFFVHYLRFCDSEYRLFESLKGKYAIFYSVYSPEPCPIVEMLPEHYWYSNRFIDPGRLKLCSNPPFYCEFFKSWYSFEQIPPFKVLFFGVNS
jgi:hypothetical protein